MQEERQPVDRGRRKGKYVRVVLLVAGVVLVLGLVVCRLLPTAEERMAAIDGARMVPDEDNAALIYAELMRGENVPASNLEAALSPMLEGLLDPVSYREIQMAGQKLNALIPPADLLDPNDEQAALGSPWTSARYPKLRLWLDRHQERIDQLLEASRKPSCYFPLQPEPNETGLLNLPCGAFRQNVQLLRQAANNDMGEGRPTAGRMKYQALISMGRHFQMQPSADALSTGIACEAIGLHHLIESVVTGPAADRDLDALAISCNDLDDRWESLSQDIGRVRSLYSQTLKDRRSFKLRLYWQYRSICYRENDWLLRERTGELYHRILSERRACCLLIELRRFRNRTGHWPETLGEIASSVAPLALVDPQNGGAYVYQRAADGFRLYSTGPNGQDENGRYTKQGPDDWPIWPPRGAVSQSRPADANAP